jgi:molybdate transport system regulatory protein
MPRKSLGVTQRTRSPKRGDVRPALTLRVDLGRRGALGPGKISLLEAIDAEGSITAAGKKLGMSYRRAWLLVESVNAMFKEPAVSTRHGGANGGNASLTRLGAEIVSRYRQIEKAAEKSASKHLTFLGGA